MIPRISYFVNGLSNRLGHSPGSSEALLLLLVVISQCYEEEQHGDD
jgi:hypothetical protein